MNYHDGNDDDFDEDKDDNDDDDDDLTWRRPRSALPWTGSQCTSHCSSPPLSAPAIKHLSICKSQEKILKKSSKNQSSPFSTCNKTTSLLDLQESETLKWQLSINRLSYWPICNRVFSLVHLSKLGSRIGWFAKIKIIIASKKNQALSLVTPQKLRPLIGRGLYNRQEYPRVTWKTVSSALMMESKFEVGVPSGKFSWPPKNWKLWGWLHYKKWKLWGWLHDNKVKLDETGVPLDWWYLPASRAGRRWRWRGRGGGGETWWMIRRSSGLSQGFAKETNTWNILSHILPLTYIWSRYE